MGIIIAISRYVLPFITVVILTKCMLSLLLGHPKEKVYGYIIDMTDGESYPLNMWETSIGRSNSCDIVIGYDTVSRFQAVISRRIDGWYVYDLLSKSGIKVNGKLIEKKATIKNGDILTFGIIQYRFTVADDPVVRVGKKKNKQSKTAPHVQERPYRPTQGTAAFNQNDFSQGGGSYYQNVQNQTNSNTSFCDYDNKPNLNFEEKASYSNQNANAASQNKYGSIYSNSNSFTVETPSRSEEQSYTYKTSTPAVMNADTGETFILCGNLVSIGRSRSNDIILNSPSVSRHHADLVLYDDGWAIVDASSSAGTYLNSNRINQPQLLFDGDVIGLSDERLYYTVNPSGRKAGK